MDTVSLDGVEYVKASVAAKQFRYTADYIGQLCRNKKIDARLVGRTWFVNVASIKDHKKHRHQKHEAPAEESSSVEIHVEPTSVEESKRKVSVAAPIKAATRKRLAEQKTRMSTERKLKVHYELDDENLIPTLHKKKTLPPRTIRIEHADASALTVTGTNTSSSFVAEPLPDVALSGNIAVEEYDTEVQEEIESDEIVSEIATLEDSVSDNNIAKNKAISDKRENNLDEKNAKSNRAAVKVKKLTPELVDDAVEPVPVTPASIAATPVVVAAPLSFVPSMVRKVPQPKRISVLVLISPLIATFLGILCAAALLMASTLLSVSETSATSHIIFSLDSFQSLMDMRW